jgi:hypothetical protein
LRNAKVGRIQQTQMEGVSDHTSPPLEFLEEGTTVLCKEARNILHQEKTWPDFFNQANKLQH